MFLRSILLGVAAAVLISAPAAADPAFAPLQPCYVVAQENQRELVHIDATGFTPLSKVDIVVDDTNLTTADVLYDGSVHGTFPAPLLDGDQRDFSVRLTEQGNVNNTITQVSKVTKFSVTQTPKSAHTDDRVRFRGRGFMADRHVFAHYVFNGKSRKTVQIAYPSAPCGTFNQRRRQFPLKKRPARGSWTIQFDQLPYYDPLAPTKVLMTIKVRRTPKGSRAR